MTANPKKSKNPMTTTGTGAGGIAMLLAVVLGLISLRASNPWLLLIACALLTPVLLSQVLRPDLRSVTVCFRSVDRVAVGSSVEQVFHVHNRSRRSCPDLRLTHAAIGFAPITLAVPALPPGGHAELVVLRPAVVRGMSVMHGLQIWTSAPFGLARHRAQYLISAQISVHPAPGPVAVVPGMAGGLGGGRPSRDGDEPHELREWRRGDSLRRVHWRATARYDRMTVVIPESTVRSRLALVIQGVEDDDVEALISAAAWTAADAVRSAGILRLSAPGRPEYVGDDPAEILDWFAALETKIESDPELLTAAEAWAGSTGTVLVATTPTLINARAGAQAGTGTGINPGATPTNGLPLDRRGFLVLTSDGRVSGA